MNAAMRAGHRRWQQQRHAEHNAEEVNRQRGIVVSAEDVDLLRDFLWTISRRRTVAYARRAAYETRNNVSRCVALHGEVVHRILGRKLAPDEEIDHIDYNGLNNRRDNLRVVRRGDNRGRTRPKGRYRGVHQHSCGRWCAMITYRGKRKYLGLFDTPEEANAAYQKQAQKWEILQ